MSCLLQFKQFLPSDVLSDIFFNDNEIIYECKQQLYESYQCTCTYLKKTVHDPKTNQCVSNVWEFRSIEHPSSSYAISMHSPFMNLVLLYSYEITSTSMSEVTTELATLFENQVVRIPSNPENIVKEQYYQELIERFHTIWNASNSESILFKSIIDKIGDLENNSTSTTPTTTTTTPTTTTTTPTTTTTTPTTTTTTITMDEFDDDEEIDYDEEENREDTDGFIGTKEDYLYYYGNTYAWDIAGLHLLTKKQYSIYSAYCGYVDTYERDLDWYIEQNRKPNTPWNPYSK